MYVLFLLNGHQIIGELRLNFLLDTIITNDWMVTRSLVSYDLDKLPNKKVAWLNGHQIIGELRRFRFY